MPSEAGVEQPSKEARDQRVLAAAALAHFINDGNSVTYAILIIYYSSLGIQLSFLGLIASAYMLVSGLISERIGYFADKSGRRGLVMSLGILSLGFAILFFSLSFYFNWIRIYLLIIGSLLLGIGLSIYHPLGGSVIAYSTYTASLARDMGVNGSFGSLGRALFPAIIVYLVTIFGLTTGLLIFSAVTILCGLLILYMTRQFDARMILRTSSVNRDVKFIIYRRFIISLTLLFFLSALFTQGVNTYIPKYFEATYRSEQLAGIATSVTYATPVIGQIILGTLTDKIGGRKILYLTTVMSAAIFALFFITYSIIAKVIILGLFAFFVYSGFPVVLGFAQQIVPREVAARLNGIVWGLGNTLGSAFGAALAGLMVDSYGFSFSFLISWLFGLAAIALLPLVPKNRVSDVS